MLIYETFMAGNEKFGKPSNPNFLLRPGELLEAFGGLTVVWLSSRAATREGGGAADLRHPGRGGKR